MYAIQGKPKGGPGRFRRGFEKVRGAAKTAGEYVGKRKGKFALGAAGAIGAGAAARYAYKRHKGKR